MERNRDSDDRRRVEVGLTTAGTDLIAELYPRFNKLEIALTDGLSAKDQQQLSTLLRRIITNADGL